MPQETNVPTDPHASCPAPTWMGTFWQCNNHQPPQTVVKNREPFVAVKHESDSNIAAVPQGATIEAQLRGELANAMKEIAVLTTRLLKLSGAQEENGRLHAELADIQAQLVSHATAEDSKRFALVMNEGLERAAEIDRLNGLLDAAGVERTVPTRIPEVPTLSKPIKAPQKS